jgi:UDP-N-acetylmuramate dehydrogenase
LLEPRLRAALERAKVAFLADEPLARHTTLGVGGPVPVYLEPASAAEAARALDLLAQEGLLYRVLGAGSNVVAADEGLDFAVVATAGLNRPPRFDGERVTADAGVFLPRLAREAASRGLAGLEFGIGIPGSVGGALRMNAGAWGSDMARVVESVVAVRPGAADEQPFAPRFAYRSAGVDAATLVTGVCLRLAAASASATLARIDALVAERRRTQPVAARSAGCAFRNPEGDHAGRLVEAAGLKGLSRGAAQVSDLHGNFLLNRGGARATDVLALLEEVKARVEERFGVKLVEEVVIWRGSAGG